jgi:hypothetical protein
METVNWAMEGGSGRTMRSTVQEKYDVQDDEVAHMTAESAYT